MDMAHLNVQLENVSYKDFTVSDLENTKVLIALLYPFRLLLVWQQVNEVIASR